MPVLCVPQFDAIVEHPHMVGSHTTDVDGFQTGDTAVILQLNAGEITDCIGNGQGIQPFDLFLLHYLGRNDFVFG